MALCAQELGSFTAATSFPGVPTTDTDGFACYGARYVNLWAQSSGASNLKYYVYVYLYRTGIGWIRYVDIPPWVLAVTPTNGLLLELEIRGAERIAVRRLGSTAEFLAKATVMIEGFTYK